MFGGVVKTDALKQKPVTVFFHVWFFRLHGRLERPSTDPPPSRKYQFTELPELINAVGVVLWLVSVLTAGTGTAGTMSLTYGVP